SWRECCGNRGRLRVLVHLRLDCRKDVPGLRAATQFCVVRLVAHPARRRRTLCAVYFIEPGQCASGTAPSCESARDKTERLPRSARALCRDLAACVPRTWQLPKPHCRRAAIRPDRASAAVLEDTAKPLPAVWLQEMAALREAACAQSSRAQIA